MDDHSFLHLPMLSQYGQPFSWMTINPADTSSPIVLKMAGVDLAFPGGCGGHLSLSISLCQGLIPGVGTLNYTSHDWIIIADADTRHARLLLPRICSLTLRRDTGNIVDIIHENKMKELNQKYYTDPWYKSHQTRQRQMITIIFYTVGYTSKTCTSYGSSGGTEWVSISTETHRRRRRNTCTN